MKKRNFSKYIKYLLIVAILFLGMENFSVADELLSHSKINKIYTDAQKNIKIGNWKQAILQLEKIENYCLYDSYYQKIQLDLIYIYYKDFNLKLAKTVADRFIRLNSFYKDIDYAIYMRGLINMALDNNALQNFFFINRAECDTKYIREAFKDFSNLIENYPNSSYLSYAIKHLIYLKNRLAEHEYYIASYYASRSAWIAVINRVDGILHNYPNNSTIIKSLRLMEKAYRKMHMNTQVNKVKKIISIFLQRQN